MKLGFLVGKAVCVDKHKECDCELEEQDKVNLGETISVLSIVLCMRLRSSGLSLVHFVVSVATVLIQLMVRWSSYELLIQYQMFTMKTYIQVKLYKLNK